MNFDQVPEFQKELKRLSKKWRSLPSDIKAAEKDITPLYVEQEGVDIQRLREAFFGGFKAAVLTTAGDDVEVIKMRLDVADLGRNNKVRIVFIAVRSQNTITFIELYAKNEKNREDQGRIKKYL
jgi:hypothetical protein